MPNDKDKTTGLQDHGTTKPVGVQASAWPPYPIPAWLQAEVAAYDLEISPPPRSILDIGANIGAFTAKAWMQGSRNIYAYEACPDNYAALVRNVGHLPGVHLFHSAVVMPGSPATLPFPAGCNSFYIPLHPLVDVPTTTLRTIITVADTLARNVRYLKIDIEGSEWEALYTFQHRCFDAIEEIRGEYHQPSSTWFTSVEK